MVFGTPTDRVTEPGIYRVAIQTNLLLGGGETKSVVSDPINIAVTDPCPFTQILSKPLPGLAADIGFFD